MHISVPYDSPMLLSPSLFIYLFVYFVPSSVGLTTCSLYIYIIYFYDQCFVILGSTTEPVL
jgi:hypothetical protein